MRGLLVRLIDQLFAGRPVERPADWQARIDARLVRVVLYEFPLCSYCIKVRRALIRLNMDVERRDARVSPAREELCTGGGKWQVPCLRIENDSGVDWMYESSDIVVFFEDLAVASER